jgi:glycosyltransferase involved in cell wall biosynthesis
VKKVLIITYYWPPSGGSGVQRCLKFAGYLRHFGWEPVVLTVKNPDYPVSDESLLEEIPQMMEVLKVPAWEPYRLYQFLLGGKKDQTHIGFISGTIRTSLLQQLFIWIRGNFFIPDGRKYWIKPSVTFLSRYVSENQIDCILSSGPPHSAHLIAKKVSRKFNIPWVADFRDPWTGVYYFSQMKLSMRSIRKHQRLEREVLNTANSIVVVGETMKNDFEKITNQRVEVIHNGYDHKDYENLNPLQDEKFSIGYTGMFFRDQNPSELWEALSELIEELPGFKDDLQLKFIGKIDAAVLAGIREVGLSKYLIHKDYVSHDRIPLLQSSMQILLLCINRIENASYILTGKVFEYLGAKRPVLAICPPDSDIARIIHSTGSGTVIPFYQKAALKEALSNYYHQFKSGRLEVNSSGIEEYSRQNLTKKLAKLFDETT